MSLSIVGKPFSEHDDHQYRIGVLVSITEAPAIQSRENRFGTAREPMERSRKLPTVT
jgi:hypothetical protein